MQLSASPSATFFTQNEYHHVELGEQELILRSETKETRVPFRVWDGRVKVKTGIVWSGLEFYSHIDGGKERRWIVQGLSPKACRQFALHAVASYEQWHATQCQQLNQYVPEWEEAIDRQLRRPTFLRQSMLAAWNTKVMDDLACMRMTLEEAELRMPKRLAPLLPWIEETKTSLQARNHQWMETELENWEVLFSRIESSPLNLSQRQAVLLNDDNNLILAGAGSGKTSVLTARVAYLLQSHLAQANQILMLAFGKDAASEMKQRLESKIGLSAEGVEVSTFHSLGLKILNDVESRRVEICPVAVDDKLRHGWCVDWLKKHWMTPTNFKRWQKHLVKWPIAYLAGDDELGSHVENPKLIAWLEKQLSQLAAMGVSKKELQQRLVEHPDYTRLNSELSLVWPCYQAWQQMLKEQQQVDFNIMISRAVDYVKKGKFRVPWKYIMVDEYQDVSPARLALIEALCTQVEPNDEEDGCALFAVGDDWQSIYQFAGSDVSLTTGFSERFQHATIHYLDTTYRFNNQLGAVANRFVQQNPQQLQKSLNSHKQQKSKAVTLAPAGQVEKILDQLDRNAKQTTQVMLLARNHYHRPELLDDWQKRFLQLSIEFMTCHASKGREADFVIILNVDEGQFPARVKALHLDGALTQSQESYPFAEERRLFYVALTRAKKKVWVTFNGSGSSFVKELLEEDYPVSIVK